MYGAPEKFLTDNGREFAKSKFIDMAKSINITVKVTAAESQFSNGLVERHNFMIADMMDNVLEKSQHLDMDLTLAWCLNAKNSLANLHGFISTCIWAKPQTAIYIYRQTTSAHST